MVSPVEPDGFHNVVALLQWCVAAELLSVHVIERLRRECRRTIKGCNTSAEQKRQQTRSYQQQFFSLNNFNSAHIIARLRRHYRRALKCCKRKNEKEKGSSGMWCQLLSAIVSLCFCTNYCLFRSLKGCAGTAHVPSKAAQKCSDWKTEAAVDCGLTCQQCNLIVLLYD